VRLGLVSTGAVARMKDYRALWNQTVLAPAVPATVSRLPKEVGQPEFAEMLVGPRGSPTRLIFLLDAATATPKLYVDMSGTGDFSATTPLPLTLSFHPPEKSKPDSFTGSLTVSFRFGAETAMLHFEIGIWHYLRDKDGTAPLPDVLLYRADYAREGEMRLAGRAYHVMLADPVGCGDFRGTRTGVPGQLKTGIHLLIDVNGNGIFDRRGEQYDTGLPFNIRGITYEIRNMDASGAQLEVVRSAHHVAEILPPPNLSAGNPAVPFTARTMSGATVHFPSDYRGRIVLLYFWGSWCPDCKNELPNLSRVYAAMHAHGLEILGASVDRAGMRAQLADFLTRNHMPWPEVYDGKWIHSAVAGLYFIHNIPTGVLVDGTTGRILASGQDVIGARLASTITKALARKPGDKGAGR
jgi:thiol-disulfide isomerase/thioredoxin